MSGGEQVCGCIVSLPKEQFAQGPAAAKSSPLRGEVFVPQPAKPSLFVQLPEGRAGALPPPLSVPRGTTWLQCGQALLVVQQAPLSALALQPGRGPGRSWEGVCRALDQLGRVPSDKPGYSRAVFSLWLQANLKKFMEYVQTLNVEKVSRLLEKGLDPNFHDPDTGATQRGVFLKRINPFAYSSKSAGANAPRMELGAASVPSLGSVRVSPRQLARKAKPEKLEASRLQ
ncbi:UNVERIFIED_CONTAM: hypothetical protein K2H54_077684 [Gekko kuhli]